MCEASKGLHIHHIIAFKISHSNSDINLVTLCRTCHPTIEAVMWKLLEEGAHRFQIYRAAWEYIKVTHDKLLLELKKN